ncbi:MAG: TonB-dependent receptor [Chitinophagales bacterium]
MKKFLLSSILIFSSILLFSQIRLSGTVIDVFNKVPLSKAIVTVNGSDNTMITDEDGFFTVVLKESGVYDIEVSKNGYKSLLETLMLNESIALQVMLTSNAGTEDPGFTAKAKKTEEKYIDRNKAKEAPYISAKTIKDKSSRNNSKTNTTAATPKVKKVVEKLAISLSGTVRDKITKTPLADVSVFIKELKRKFTTGVDGTFYLEIYKKDSYTVQIKANGYQTESDIIPVFEDLVLDVFMSKKQKEETDITELTAETVVISRTRAGETTPTTFKKVDKEDLEINNIGKDLPYLLELTPSVVASSDGGNGVGYTAMRIRGSDMTRINFTLNGFPVNDAESQGVFLVNTPDLASSIEDIQIQRGIGTSTNGAGAFGASVNINTNKIRKKAYAEFNNGFGTFNTFKNTIKVGTGELFNHFSFDGRFSHLATDGYIDRASAKMFGYALTGTYYNKNSMIRFNFFSGNEKTYQAWNGIDYQTLQTNRTFNSAGTDYVSTITPYDNEIDNYNQDNYQLSLSHEFGKYIDANLGFHYTKGKGYFEQYKVGQDLIDYGLISASNNTDLIRRRWLDNDFFGTIFSVNYKRGKLNTTLGGGWNQYDGDHFGEIIWAKDAQNIKKDELYYFNDALKTDFNTFLKAEYKIIKRLVAFADIQYRNVAYSADGVDNDQQRLFEDADFNFVNPKAGLTLLLGKKLNSQLYASFAMANREPTRNDFIDNDKEPLAENMMDFELGFRHKSKKLSYAVNAFYMKYKNQLVLTGELNDVGSAVRANVENSFRTGLEVEVAYEPFKYLGFAGAGAFSLNEIESFTFTNYLGLEETHDKTKIAYAPTIVGNFTLYSKPFKGFEIALINKYVSEQFLDNTNSKDKILTPYFLNDARLSYSIYPKFMREIQLIIKANNILNVKYSANGYVFYDSPYFYPQAGTTFEGTINLKF